jgi:hypothetical protein
MVVGIFDLRLGLSVGAAIIPFILITDAIFSAIVTFSFLKPILDALQAARGTVQTAAKRRLDRIKRWNFAGLVLTVVSSTALYLHVIAFYVLSVLRRYSLLHSSVFGHPHVFGVQMVSMLNILGMILLCGMFKRHGAFFSRPIVQEKSGTIRAGRAKKRIRNCHQQPRILRAGKNARRIVIIAGTSTHTYTTIMTLSFNIKYERTNKDHSVLYCMSEACAIGLRLGGVYSKKIAPTLISRSLLHTMHQRVL